jgi:hypothetical protein
MSRQKIAFFMGKIRFKNMVSNGKFWVRHYLGGAKNISLYGMCGCSVFCVVLQTLRSMGGFGCGVAKTISYGTFCIYENTFSYGIFGCSFFCVVLKT